MLGKMLDLESVYFGTLLLLLFAASLLLQVYGYDLGREASTVVSVVAVGICLIIVLNFFFFSEETSLFFRFKPWMNVDTLLVDFGFMMDEVSMMMLFVILFVSLMVHFFSIEYMYNDPAYIKFMAYLNLFTAFMIVLVTADNLVLIFVGWEGVGLCSYLLMNFWGTSVQANKAALKAMVMNKIGDCGFLIAILFAYKYFGTSNIVLLKVLFPYFYNFTINDCSLATIMSLFLLMAMIGKSAQIGLHTWLPDAMEGPTPVSALIHAATMVTAGVYLAMRLNFIFEASPLSLWICIFMGSATTVFGAIIAYFQNDVKKMMAYSTCSQLGYMILACGFENYVGALFHLFTHAFFKALLFLTAGYLIHTMVDEQDVSMFGAAYYNKVPIHYAGLFIGSMILAGLPMCSGMLSKDFILETGNASVFMMQANFFMFVSTVSIFFSTLYSVSMLYLSFFVRTKPNKVQLLRLSFDGNFISIGVIVVLSLCSMVFGYLFEDVFRIHNFSFFDNVGYYSGMDVIYIEHEFVSTFVKLIPSMCMMLAVVAYFMVRHIFSMHFSNFGNWFFMNKFGMDYIYGKIFNVLFQISLKMYLILEKGLFSVDFVSFFLKIGTKCGSVFNSIMWSDWVVKGSYVGLCIYIVYLMSVLAQ